MALVDFVSELASHQFTDLLHFRETRPGVISNSLAISILESEQALDRSLSSQEEGWLGDMLAGLIAGDFTARDLEAAQRLLEAGWITQSQFLAVLGL